MSKLALVIGSRRFWLAAAAILLAGWLLGWLSQAVILRLLAEPDPCWRPGLARNAGIAIEAGCE